MDYWWVLLLGILFNFPVGWFAYRKQTLTVPGGIVTAGICGYFLFIIHPVFWFLLLSFFASSTLLTRFKEDNSIKKEAMSLAEKGGQRDYFQVLANAGIPTFLAFVGLLLDGFSTIELNSWYSIAIVLSFAVVNADTWATELGVTSNSDPFWILNPTIKVPRGTSGGISPRGLLASFLASGFIAIIYAISLLITSQFELIVIIFIIIGGLLGSLIDSFFGATLQTQYYCSTCDKLTEQTHHKKCDTKTVHKRGFTWFSNDLVNLLSVVLTVLIFLLLLW